MAEATIEYQAILNRAGVPEIGAGPLSERPAPGSGAPGRLYLVTEPDAHSALYRDTGVSWRQVVGAVPPAGLRYLHTQSLAASTWTVAHGLGRKPIVQVLDSAGTEVFGEVKHLNADTLTVSFGAPFGGECICS